MFRNPFQQLLQVVFLTLTAACFCYPTFAQEDLIFAQEDLIDDRPPSVKLRLIPTPEPRIAFQYHLLPRENEIQEGDAVPFYDVAILNHKQHSPDVTPIFNDMWDDFDEVKPIAEFPVDMAKRGLRSSYTTLKYLRYGSVRKDAHWAVPYQDEKENRISILLEEANEIRMMGYILAIEARTAVYENRPLDALESIRAGYAMARHLSRGHFIVEGLIANHVVGRMNQELWYVLQHPDCPNLYWSLTELPRPFLEHRRLYDRELDILYDLFPGLRRVEKEKLTPEEYTAIYLHLVSKIEDYAKQKQMKMFMKSSEALFEITKTTDAAAGMPAVYAKARAKLLATGYSEEVVNKMGMAEAILKQIIDADKVISSEVMKYAFLPDDEIQSFSANSAEYTSATFKKYEIIPLSSVLLPVMTSARNSYMKRDREFAALRTFEAIRMHVHKTGGLPNDLSEITIVPVPNDPTTGKPLDYKFFEKKLAGKESVNERSKATLATLTAGKNRNPFDDFRYEISLVSNKEEYVTKLAQEKADYKVKLANTPPKPKEEPITPPKPGPRDGEPVAAKDQKYHEVSTTDDAQLKISQAKFRDESINNGKQLGLAMNTFNEKHKTYPPAYIADKDGKPLLSWRVMILPFLDENKLYKQFKLDEPWDSEHNKKLIAKMPDVFKSPLSKPLEVGKTCYLVPFGKETVFTGPKGTSIREVRDGMSKTLAVVEAAPESAVEWTKPTDWNFDLNEPEPFKGLFGLRDIGVVCVFCDGSSRILQPTIKRGTMKAIITKANADVYDWDNE